MTGPYLDSSVSVVPQHATLEVLGELRRIRHLLEALNEGSALFGTATSRSSVQLEQGAKEVRLTVKLYDGSPLGSLGDDAVVEFGRLFREIERRQLAGWQETVDIAAHMKEWGCEKVVDGPGSWHWSHSNKCLLDEQGCAGIAKA